jgi:hydrogenase maturation protease
MSFDLVIGYGNTLRGDDGVGPKTASAVEAWNRDGVRVIACHQLGPELAASIASARRVIFVDAATGGPGPVQVRPLEPKITSEIATHAADPQAVMGLARLIFGGCPPAWWVMIPVQKFEFGEELSPPAREGMAAALDRIRSMLA